MSKVVVITGMHRSGTSLVANLFQRAGVNIGDSLVPAGPANPRGFFEDVDFFRFHEDALHTRGLNIFVREPLVFVPTDEEQERASELVQQRRKLDLWGWKDPRTSLFLRFWDNLLDDARFLFVYRHPIDVLSSLQRRRSFAASDLTSALDAWHTYNAAILDFFMQHRERSVLADMYALVDRPEATAEVLRERLGVGPGPEDIGALYEAGDLKRIVDEDVAPLARSVLSEVHPAADQLLAELEKAADLSTPSEAGRTAPVKDLVEGLRSIDGSNETARHVLLAILLEQIDEASSRRFWRELPAWARDLEVGLEWNARRAASLEEIGTREAASAAAAAEYEAELRSVREQMRDMRERTRDLLDQLAGVRHEYSYLLTVDERLRGELSDLRARIDAVQEARSRAETALEELHRTRALRLIKTFWRLKDALRRTPTSKSPSATGS